MNGARFASRGHGFERFFVDVYANAAAKGAWGAADGQMPQGAVLVKEQLERGAKEGTTSLFVMEKRAQGEWQYLVVAPSGEVAADGKLAACMRCHDDAPRDHVFGLP
jgi:hypothetical protein